MHRLRAQLETDVDEIDRESITRWLMYFSAKKPLKLHHPRMGNIHFEGVAFAGSVIAIFDRYVRLAVEDRIELRLRSMEDAVDKVASADRQSFINDAVVALVTARGRLLGRAGLVKGKLLERASAIEIHAGPDQPIDIGRRLSDRITWLQRDEDRRVMVTEEAIRRLDSAIERLATAGYGDFPRAAKRLAMVLQSAEFAPTCTELTHGVDIKAFLKSSAEKHEYVGEPLPLPDDPTAEMGIVISLIDYLGGSGAGAADNIVINYYNSGSSYEDAWRKFVSVVIVPFRNDLIDHLAALGRLAPQSAPPVSNLSINVHGSQGVAIQHGSPGAVQTVTHQVDAAAASKALDALTSALTDLSLASATRNDVDAELDTIRAQLKKTAPSGIVLKESGKTLRTLVEGVAANLASPHIADVGAVLWNLLT